MLSFPRSCLAPAPTPARPLEAVVAIPARDEAGTVEACLRALAGQRDRAGSPLAPGRFAVVLLANNCRDGTADRARALDGLPFPLHCREVELPPAQANAGAARRHALDIAAGLLDEQGDSRGVLLTTDADTQVSPTWLSDTLVAVAAGADAVAGSLDFAADEGPGLAVRPAEIRFAALSDALVAAIDPRPHDPWPNHRWAWGASLAVRLSVYRGVGGLPPVSLAEDRAFVAALEARDARVRHALDIRVCTSSRTRGRAPGGLADMLRSFAEDGDALCDAHLETVAATVRRAVWRARLRRLHGAGELWATRARWAPRLGLDAAGPILPDAPHGPFGATWQAVERDSPHLRRERLHPRRLPIEIARGERCLRLLEAWPSTRSPDEPVAGDGPLPSCAVRGRIAPKSLFLRQ